MTPYFHGSRKTGPKPSFQRSDAVDAALRIGLHRFTLSGIAKELGVGTSTLYRVISSRDELVGLCLDAIAHTVLPLPAVGEQTGNTWRSVLKAFAHSLWDVLERHAGLDHVLVSTPSAFEHFVPVVDNLEAQLHRAGFPPERQRFDFAIDIIGDTVLTTHLQVGYVRDYYAATPLPHDMSHDHSVLSPSPQWLDKGNLAMKIEFILRGIEAGHDVHPS